MRQTPTNKTHLQKDENKKIRVRKLGKKLKKCSSWREMLACRNSPLYPLASSGLITLPSVTFIIIIIIINIYIYIYTYCIIRNRLEHETDINSFHHSKPQTYI